METVLSNNLTSRHGKLWLTESTGTAGGLYLEEFHTQATAFEPCHARMLHHQEAHLTSLTTHHYISLSLSVSLYPSTLLLIVWHMNSYDTLLVISHLRKLGTQPSALLHSSLGKASRPKRQSRSARPVPGMNQRCAKIDPHPLWSSPGVPSNQRIRWLIASWQSQVARQHGNVAILKILKSCL